MPTPTPEKILAEIQRRMDIAAAHAEASKVSAWDSHYYQAARSELNSLSDWIVTQIMLGEG